MQREEMQFRLKGVGGADVKKKKKNEKNYNSRPFMCYNLTYRGVKRRRMARKFSTVCVFQAKPDKTRWDARHYFKREKKKSVMK